MSWSEILKGPQRRCAHCGRIFSESELELSHDVPKYLGGTDKDGRHYLCHRCHKEYELKTAMYVIIRFLPFRNEKVISELKKRAKRWFND